MRTWLGALVAVALGTAGAAAQVNPFQFGDRQLTTAQRDAMYANWRDLAENGEIGDTRTWGGGSDPRGQARLDRRYERDGMQCVDLTNQFSPADNATGASNQGGPLVIPACKTPDGWRFAF